ncbi:TerC family protein [Aquibacillus salsiterrae]|uniref:TerC family protein n=1 Tax=Aquibacillus salsiterrae TaxID=2950439 RepID=A0A9X3WEL6_9BACI|nr:TerC family protein [Aquibacillus salsiterrae]MDC3416820.1 TerC family protein [Aquibacillus salsiterrae]
MDVQILFEYGWVLLVLIALEGLLSADNALVLAIMAKHLPEEQQKKALNMGLLMAFVFRVGSLFIISFLYQVWQVQAIGAAYLIFIALKHLMKSDHEEKEVKNKSYRATIASIAFADIAFAVDSILAAVALVIALPETGLGQIGGMDAAKFVVIVLAGIAGLLVIRFAAALFVKLLKERPSLEKAAFVIVGWVGVKLTVNVLAHKDIGILPYEFAHSVWWKLFFYGVLIAIVLVGWFTSGGKKGDQADGQVEELTKVLKDNKGENN